MASRPSRAREAGVDPGLDVRHHVLFDVVVQQVVRMAFVQFQRLVGRSGGVVKELAVFRLSPCRAVTLSAVPCMISTGSVISGNSRFRSSRQHVRHTSSPCSGKRPRDTRILMRATVANNARSGHRDVTRSCEWFANREQAGSGETLTRAFEEGAFGRVRGTGDGGVIGPRGVGVSAKATQ
jgi:hypothetical protein